MVLICLFLGVGCTPPAQTSLSGTIQKMDDTFILMTDDQTQYKVEGADVSEMVFQRVKVTGTVLEDGQGKTINILTYEPEE